MHAAEFIEISLALRDGGGIVALAKSTICVVVHIE